ncbi:hypothetical protein NPX13_g11410 [Xylaria arbuscula]|uniref:Uncharacterized protein n=1 Tax=Xylaria arbuscula TaxID=114810 RepID=A0A9W8N2W9_9PEZI|nr:hypothetical protein NPX13_g11410 [Xylaria arbuscula]
MAPREFTKTADGVEAQFSTNHLGHFLLTNLLLPEIRKARGVVTTATGRSWTMVDPDYDDVNFSDGKNYHGWIAFSRSKTANIHFSKALARRVDKLGVSAFAVDPGTVLDSKLIANSSVDNDWVNEAMRLITERGNRDLLGPVISLQQGAASAVLTFLDPSLRAFSGAYLEECEVRDQKLAGYVTDEAQAEKLWRLSEVLVGEKFSW